MAADQELMRATLDALSDHIVVLGEDGRIRYANRAWRAFGERNGCPIQDWEGIDYLEVCDTAANQGDTVAEHASRTLHAVLTEGGRESLDYPCHAPNARQWYHMEVNAFTCRGELLYAVSHRNITERKLEEESLYELARSDGLTGLANRRRFDEFLAEKWEFCRREGLPVTVLVLDVDQFKELNDQRGHAAGDQALIQVADALGASCARSGDLLARCGGDEFLAVLAGTEPKDAMQLSESMRQAVRGLGVPNGRMEGPGVVTLSVGVAGTVPDATISSFELLSRADRAMYAVKASGGDQVRMTPDSAEVDQTVSGS